MSDENTEQQPDEQVDPLAAIKALNADKIRLAIARDLPLDPIMQLKLRLDALTQFTVPEAVAPQFEFTFEVMLSQWLDEVLRPKLVVPE